MVPYLVVAILLGMALGAFARILLGMLVIIVATVVAGLVAGNILTGLLFFIVAEFGYVIALALHALGVAFGRANASSPRPKRSDARSL